MKFEVYWDEEAGAWLAKRANDGLSLEAAMGLAKELNAARGRLRVQAAALARAWRVGESAAAYVMAA